MNESVSAMNRFSPLFVATHILPSLSSKMSDVMFEDRELGSSSELT